MAEKNTTHSARAAMLWGDAAGQGAGDRARAGDRGTSRFMMGTTQCRAQSTGLVCFEVDVLGQLPARQARTAAARRRRYWTSTDVAGQELALRQMQGTAETRLDRSIKRVQATVMHTLVCTRWCAPGGVHPVVCGGGTHRGAARRGAARCGVPAPVVGMDAEIHNINIGCGGDVRALGYWGPGRELTAASRSDRASRAAPAATCGNPSSEGLSEHRQHRRGSQGPHALIGRGGSMALAIDLCG